MSERGYRVELAPAAARQLRKLPPGSAAALRGPILALALEPRPPGAAKLSGSDYGRIRVGDIRVIYAIEDAQKLIIVLRVARRAASTYRQVG